jgi:hypothetical protein
MMTAQLEMDLAAVEPPKIAAEELAALEGFLETAGGWVKAKEFPAPWGERRLRAAAHESEGRIISGQRGYKLTRLATIEEVQHAAAWLRHQAQAMQRRALEIDRVYHRKLSPRGTADVTG